MLRPVLPVRLRLVQDAAPSATVREHPVVKDVDDSELLSAIRAGEDWAASAFCRRVQPQVMTRTLLRSSRACRHCTRPPISTPVLARVKDKPQLLVATSNGVEGVNPEDGKVVWSCQGSGDTVSPVLGGGVVYSDNGRGGMGAAVDPTGTIAVPAVNRHKCVPCRS